MHFTNVFECCQYIGDLRLIGSRSIVTFWVYWVEYAFHVRKFTMANFFPGCVSHWFAKQHGLAVLRLLFKTYIRLAHSKMPSLNMVRIRNYFELVSFFVKFENKVECCEKSCFLTQCEIFKSHKYNRFTLLIHTFLFYPLFCQM